MAGGAEWNRWNRLRALGRCVRDLVYPPLCVLCDARTDDGALVCDACMATNRPVLPPFCNVCGSPYEAEITAAFRCANCSGRAFAFDFAIAGWRFTGAARQLVYHFKYRYQLYLRHTLAALASRALDDPRIDRTEPWLMVPVPLHPRKARERGFNQSDEIARLAGAPLGLPVVAALRRTRYTESQVGLTRDLRLLNPAGAFALRRPAARTRARIEGRPVLLIDDVFTTGATAHECARVLVSDGGAQKVIVVTATRG